MVQTNPCDQPTKTIWIAYNMVRPFMNERIKNSIFFHYSFESLHEHVPKQLLPKEYGGDMGPYDNHEAAKKVFDSEIHFRRAMQFVQANKWVWFY